MRRGRGGRVEEESGRKSETPFFPSFFFCPCITVPPYPNLWHEIPHNIQGLEHGLSACTVDNPLARACGLSLHTGRQSMLYLSLNVLTEI